MRLEQAPALALALLLLTACTGGGDDASPPPAASEGASAAAPEQPDAPSQEEVEDLAAQEALASATLRVAWVEGAQVTLDVLGFEEAGELVRMRLRATADLPPGTDTVNVGAAQVGEEFQGGRPVAAELVDPAGLKAYDSIVARTQQDVLRLTDDEPRLVVLYFAQPEGDVETVDVNLGPFADPLTDVPFDLS